MREHVADAEERLNRLLALQALLASVSRQIGPALELQPVLQTVLEAMRSLVRFRGGSIQLLDDQGMLYVAAADPPVSPEVAAARLPVGSGLSGRVLATGQAVYSPNLDDDSRVDPGLRKLGSNSGMSSYLAVPLVVLGNVIGLMQVDSSDVDAFDVDDEQVLEGLAIQVAGAIESARRHEAIMELERMKSDFIARVSHELRTPITIVSGFTETLVHLGATISDQQRDEILARMRSAGHRLQLLVDELLTVSGYEAGVIAPHPSEVQLLEILDQVREAAPAPLQVTVGCAPDLHLLVDPKLLRHTLRLLVDNAIKYAGDATITARREDGTGDVIIDIVDHGPGIPVHLRDRVFQRFTRGDETLPGMGLGLPLAKMLAGVIGAVLELHHPESGGTRFRVRFPSTPPLP